MNDDRQITIVPPLPSEQADALFERWKKSRGIGDDDPRLDRVVIELIRSSSRRTLKQYRVNPQILENPERKPEVEERALIGRTVGVGDSGLLARFSTVPPWRVEVVVDAETIVSSEEGDVFHALRDARRTLEAMNVQICCNGARLDVRPSGMPGGQVAYFRSASTRPLTDEPVDIFDPAPCAAVGSVNEQSEAIRVFLSRRTEP